MKSKREKLFLKVLFVFFICVILNSNLAIAYVWHNSVGNGYVDDEGGSASKAITIESYVVEAGGYYLSANSSFQKLMELVELQDVRGVDYAELQEANINTSLNIRKAISTYDRLIELAEVTPYNGVVIFKLRGFDYEKFMGENGLNQVVFARVRDFLQKGDITGIFRKVHSDLKDISAMLEGISAYISSHKMPNISGIWRLNEKFAEVSLFGSYVARVFSEV